MYVCVYVSLCMYVCMYVCELVYVCMYVCMYVCVYRYCPSCKTDSSEVIAAGEKMRITKKKANMMSKKHECNRDWGKVCEPGRERERGRKRMRMQ